MSAAEQTDPLVTAHDAPTVATEGEVGEFRRPPEQDGGEPPSIYDELADAWPTLYPQLSSRNGHEEVSDGVAGGTAG